MEIINICDNTKEVRLKIGDEKTPPIHFFKNEIGEWEISSFCGERSFLEYINSVDFKIDIEQAVNDKVKHENISKDGIRLHRYQQMQKNRLYL